MSPKEIKTVFETSRPTIKNIIAVNKAKQNSKGGRGGKAKRDPNMPKKPPSPYFLFCGKMRPIVSKKDSSLHPQQVVTELGKLWKELPEDQKEVSWNRQIKEKIFNYFIFIINNYIRKIKI